MFRLDEWMDGSLLFTFCEVYTTEDMVEYK